MQVLQIQQIDTLRGDYQYQIAHFLRPKAATAFGRKKWAIWYW